MSVSPGLGTGLCYTPSVTVISSYFHKYRVVANGVTLASPGIGIVAVPYLLRWLIEDYGWRFAMSLCGCFMAQVGTVMSLCVMSLCQSSEPLCHCVSLGNRYVTVSVLVLVIHYHDRRCAYSVNVSVLVIHDHVWQCAYSVTVFLSWLTKF